MCVCESALNRTASPHLPARSLPSTLALPTSRCNWLTGGGGRGIAAAPNMCLIMRNSAEGVLFSGCCLPRFELLAFSPAHLGFTVWHVVVINTRCSLW